MIITPRMESQTPRKLEALVNQMHAHMREIRDLEDAYEAKVTFGEEADLARVIDSTKNLLEAHTQFGEGRIKAVTVSNLIPLCKRTLSLLQKDNADTAALVQEWGNCFATILTEKAKREDTADPVMSESVKLKDVAGKKSAIPMTTGNNHYVVKKMSLVFTTRTSLNFKKSNFPESYMLSQFAGGYVIADQIVIGMNVKSVTKAAIRKQVDAVVHAYKAQGKHFVNVLGSREAPYFWHRGNPLVFVWLMPEQIYSRAPFEVQSVDFNIVEHDDPVESDQRAKVQAKIKKDREAFEAYLVKDKEYTALLQKMQDSKLRQTGVGALHVYGTDAPRSPKGEISSLRASLEKRKNELRDIFWLAKLSPDAAEPKPKVKVPVKWKVAKPALKVPVKTTRR